jgi:hypothetical protein
LHVSRSRIIHRSHDDVASGIVAIKMWQPAASGLQFFRRQLNEDIMGQITSQSGAVNQTEIIAVDGLGSGGCYI